MSLARLYEIPIAARPPKTLFQIIHGLAFLVIFLYGCLSIAAIQFLILIPLRLLPSKHARALYDQGVRYSRGAFGLLASLMCQIFAPTELRVTFETDGPGAFTKDQLTQIIERDASGRVLALHLPKKMIIIANHQMYADWWYLWILLYYMNLHRDVLIVLKKSLKWVPFFGWGMQVYRFIFLARSWASDKHILIKKLAKIGRKAQQEDTPLAFVFYPEGTLVSANTRSISKKYADKTGISDLSHMLLPHSTGLHYVLQALSPRIPDLRLLDVTVAYPGIPPMGYAQSYYTLRSIFMDRVPPPVVYIHLRLFDVSKDVPFGKLSVSNSEALYPTPTENKQNEHVPSSNGVANTAPNSLGEAIHATERDIFDKWLRDLWQVKDGMLDAYHRIDDATGAASSKADGGRGFSSGAPSISIPAELRNVNNIPDALCLVAPPIGGLFLKRILGYLR